MNLSLDCLVLFLVLLSTKELWNHFNEQSQTGLPGFRRISSLWEARGVSVSASVACVLIASAKVRRFTAPRKKIHEKSGCFCKNRSLFSIPTLQTIRKEAVFEDFRGLFRPSRSLTEEKRGRLSENYIIQYWNLTICKFTDDADLWNGLFLTTTGTTFPDVVLVAVLFDDNRDNLGQPDFFVVNVVLVVVLSLTTTGTT